MADENELTEAERRLWEYIQKNDFEGQPWSTPAAAKKLKMKDDEVYTHLAELVKKLKGEMYIYYKKGAIRIATE
jgi:hypothetical protein